MRPLQPVQVAALHDIIRQIYLSSEPYPPMRGVGFLGVSYEPTWIAASPGLLVADRVPGFDGFRVLRDGDVIIKILDIPESAMQDSLDLRTVVQKLGPGQSMRLELLRDGRTLNVTVQLELRPRDLPDFGVAGSAWLNGRERKAEKFWDQNFSFLDHDAATTEAASTS
jgi:S1-C subfamily serine protease